jgi:hypothetical protein
LNRAAIQRLVHELDHRLIRHPFLDLVAVRRKRSESEPAGMADDLAHEPALADSRLAFQQRNVTAAGGESRDEADQMSEFIGTTDERDMRETRGALQSGECRIV